MRGLSHRLAGKDITTGAEASRGDHMTVPGHSYALLADGATVEIRPAGPGDIGTVRRFHQDMSPDNLYLRFFSMSKRAGEQEARRVCRPPDAGHAALLALLGPQLVGVASYELTGTPGQAEIAFAVADDIEVTLPIPGPAALGADSAYLDAVAGREQRADVASLAPLLAPRSVAVVGASRRERSIGRTILLNIRDAGFAGALFAVNPHAEEIGGVPCLPSVADLPAVPDLVVVAVPPAQVSKVARECGKRGVRGLVVITSGLGASGDNHLLEICRQYGMRLVGPNCFGVAVPGLGLDATFAVRHPAAGVAGLVVQSGGIGIALLEHFSRLGIGVSSFASVGDKMDVSGNDLLMWWEQ